MSDASYSKSRLIPAIILAIYVYGSIAALLGTILPEIGQLYGLDETQLGYVAMTQAIGLIIASVSVGPIVDNRGKKAGLVGGLAGITVALVGLTVAQSYLTLLGTMFLLGLGGGVLVTGSNALVSDVAEEKRASVLNFLNLFFGLGGMATPLLAANIPALDTAQALCLFLAAISGCTLLLHIFTPMPPPTGERGFVLSEAGALLRQPALYLLSLTLFLYVACEVGVFNWLVTYLVSQGVEESFAQNTLAFGFALGLLLGRLAVSRILLGISELKVMLWTSVAMAVTTFAMLHTGDPMIAGVAVFLAGLAMAPVFPTTLGVVGNVFRRMTGTAMGIVITSGWIGLAVSSPIIGWMADRSDLGSALLLLPAMSVVLVGTNLLLRRHMSKPAVERA